MANRIDGLWTYPQIKEGNPADSGRRNALDRIGGRWLNHHHFVVVLMSYELRRETDVGNEFHCCNNMCYIVDTNVTTIVLTTYKQVLKRSGLMGCSQGLVVHNNDTMFELYASCKIMRDTKI